MIFNSHDVLDYLPHRSPFLFVDKIQNVELVQSDLADLSDFKPKDFLGSVVYGDFTVKSDLDILRGHFPGAPILPGVVQVEMMGQVCPFLFKYAYQDIIQDYKIKVQLLGIDKARFKKPVTPGDKLKIKTTLKKVKGIFQNYDCEIRNADGAIVSYAEILASIEFIKKA